MLRSKKLLLVFAACCCSVGYARADWLTVTGDRSEPQFNIVEVQPESRSVSAGLATLNIRVSRSAQRTSTDGVTFRSFTASVEVKCAEKTARFVTVAFYMAPMWEGKPHQVMAFSAAQNRPMLFRSIEPNPTERIIRAACQPLSR